MNLCGLWEKGDLKLIGEGNLIVFLFQNLTWNWLRWNLLTGYWLINLSQD